MTIFDPTPPTHPAHKPENILLHCPGPYPRILIADFGLARPNAYQETFNVCGTISYLPPEGVLALDVKHLGYVGSDWVSHIKESRIADLTQPSQRYINTEARLKSRILGGKVEFQAQWKQLQKARELVERLLVYDYRLRATVRCALNSPWVVSELEALEKLYGRRISDEVM
ncbi:hypothetical protein H0H93_014159 [Arthromyces matolae]|nr:hypothetical protein H0H93_014159 [Arthromyces matolae]